LRYALSTALRRCGRSEEAEQEFHRVEETKAALAQADRQFDIVRSDPQSVSARFEIGRIFLEHLSENQGLVWLNSVLTLDPDHLPAHRLLADYFEKNSRRDAAFERRAREHRRRVHELEKRGVD